MDKMMLYAIKCDGGYIKVDNSGSCQVVAIERATVFKRDTQRNIPGILREARSIGADNIRIVEWQLLEKEPFVFPDFAG